MKALVEKIFIVPDGQICMHKGTMQNNSDKISWKSNFHNWKDDKCSRGGDWKEFKAAPFILKPVNEWPFLCSDMRRDFGPLWFYRYVNASCGPAAEIVWQTKCLRGESLPANWKKLIYIEFIRFFSTLFFLRKLKQRILQKDKSKP